MPLKSSATTQSTWPVCFLKQSATLKQERSMVMVSSSRCIRLCANQPFKSFAALTGTRIKRAPLNFTLGHMRVLPTIYVCLVTFALACSGCVSIAGARQLSGTYVHPQTGGVIIFRPDGRFYYSFITPTNELPRNLGHYRFENPTDVKPELQVRSAHYGHFSIRVSESGDRVFLTAPNIFASEQVYEKQ